MLLPDPTTEPVVVPEERRRAHILLVDDHPANLLALEAILEPLGQDLVKAHSGEEALKALLKQDFACILMDVQMPGLDGFQTAALIKQRERTRTIPILFLTALSRDAAHVFKGYAHGAVDYLLKPFDPEILRSKVSVFVDLFLKEQQLQRASALLRLREREALERQSELRFRRLTDSIPQALWAARPDGRFYYANHGWYSFTGTMPPREGDYPTLERFLESVHPDDRGGLAEAWEKSLRTGRGHEREFRLRRVDGVWRWHLARAVPEHDERQQLVGWIASATDIDDKRRAEEGLTRFKATLDATLDCVLMFNPLTLELTYANAGAARQLGHPVEELVSLRFTDVEGGVDEQGLTGLLAPLLSGALGVQQYTTAFRRRGGGEVPVEVVLQYVPTGDGQGRCVAVARDITERMRAETALKLANEAKDAFLAAASHELRTPLAAAKGHAHLALMKMGEGGEVPPAARNLQVISRQIDRMTKLVEDLLDISRLQSGRLQLEPEAFDLMQLVHEACERMGVLGQGHALEVEGPAQLEGVWDHARLDQVLTNLLSNALRYSPDGGRIAVMVREDGEGVRVSVRDQGVGIPPEKQSVIFERFGRAHGAKFGGLGLGLTITQGIVEQHGGRIWVESTGVAGEGSTFHVWLPRQVALAGGGSTRPPPRTAAS